MNTLRKAIAVATLGCVMALMLATAACSTSPSHQPQPVDLDSLLARSTTDRYGLTVGIDSTQATVYLIFSADSTFEGAPAALDAMEQRGIKASFFFTGNFLRRPSNDSIIARIASLGHYIGPHSDGHILLADWADGRPSLVTPDSLLADTHRNLRALAAHGIDTTAIHWYLPPYEWAARCHVDAVATLGMVAVNPSPGIMTYRDYTTPDMTDYWASDSILQQFYHYERAHTLCGALVIVHLGTHPDRTDKFYRHLPSMLDSITSLGYRLDRLP